MTDLPSICLATDSKYAQFYAEGQQVHAYTLSQPDFWNCIWERFSFWTAGIIFIKKNIYLLGPIRNYYFFFL